MADTQTFDQNSFSTENDQVGGYRRLSRLAVWSIPLGLASALAMVSPLLWFVPIVAVCFALGGLWAIAQSDDTTGRPLALIGLSLAIVFGTWGITWTVSRQVIINRQAREHATEWFGLMQNQEYMKAHQLSIAFVERLPAGLSLEEHYAQPENVDEVRAEVDMDPAMPAEPELAPFEDLSGFKTNGIPQILVEAKGDFEFEFVKNLNQLRDDAFATMVNQVFHLTFADDHEPKEMDIKIELVRTIDASKAYWQVGQVSDANESS